MEKRPLFELGQRQWDNAELRQRLESICRENTSFGDFLLEGEFPEVGLKRFRLTARRLDRGPREPNMILLVMEGFAP